MDYLFVLCLSVDCASSAVGVVGRIAFRAVVDGDKKGIFHTDVRLCSVGKDSGWRGHSMRRGDNFCVSRREREKMTPEKYDFIEIMFIFAKESSVYLLLSIHSYP